MDGLEGASGAIPPHSVLLQVWSLEPRQERSIWDGARARGDLWWPSLLCRPLGPLYLAGVTPVYWLQAACFLLLLFLPLLMGLGS